MNKVIELVKRHKGLAIVGSLSLILCLVIFMIFAKMIFSNGQGEYGKRLEGIVNVDKKTLKDVKSSIEGEECVDSAKVRIQGKIIYITIYFKEGTDKNKAFEISNNSLSKFDKEVIEDYDFGYFLKENVNTEEDKDKKGFVITGTKHPDIDKISWIKN